MLESRVIQKIAQKEIDKQDIADEVIKQPELLSDVMAGLGAHSANIKFGCAKVLRLISEKQPALLYPEMDFFIGHLDNENNIFKWTAICILANLAAVDSQNRIEQILDKYFQPIMGPVLITATNSIAGAARIALAKPGLVDRITQELLKVERAEYQTAECRNIALGHVIKAFSRLFERIEDKEAVIKLTKKQLTNARDGTRKKATKFLEKYAPQMS